MKRKIGIFIFLIIAIFFLAICWITSREKTEYRHEEIILDNSQQPCEVSEPITDTISSEENISLSEDMICYIIDDKVNEITLFSSFINGEVTAYDNELQDNLYCKDYYEIFYNNRNGISSLQIAAEDLSGDGNEELMIILENRLGHNDLYVFHEEDGELYAWDRIEMFLSSRSDTIILKDGTLEFWGGYGFGRFFERYNENGKIENILSYLYHSDRSEDGHLYDYVLIIYEQGAEIKRLEYSLFAPTDLLSIPDEWELVAGTQEEMEEFDRLLEDFLAGLADEARSFYSIQNGNNVEKIPLSALLN